MTNTAFFAARRMFACLVVLTGLFAAAAVMAPRPAEAQTCSPSWNGKYQGLIKKLNVPGDLGQYGRCYHWGKWSGSSYKGHSVPNDSYWVYSYPNWYVWQSAGGGRVQNSESGCSPSKNGKYSGLIAKLPIPGDQRQYGACHDYGRWNASSYKGYTVPSGSYWVYSAPHWYVWKNRSR